MRQDGVHVDKKKEEEEVTDEQKKVMRTQDIKYVEMKRVSEAKVSCCVCVCVCRTALDDMPELMQQHWS